MVRLQHGQTVAHHFSVAQLGGVLCVPVDTAGVCTYIPVSAVCEHHICIVYRAVHM